MLEKFCKNYGLGSLISEPQQVSGGLLHIMYRVETESGVYAVKVLNPEIMQRPAALQNMIHSEQVAHALESVVPVVAVKEFDGKHVVELDGTWFMAFDWLEGASVFAPEITAVHCAKIGQMLGKIHAANVQIEGLEPEAEVRAVFAWNELVENWNGLSTGKEVSSAGLEALEDFLPELWMLDKETVSALQQLSAYQVISHRDLDPKNVMWQGSQPYLIDWEAAGYVNPYQELVEVLNYWITDVDGTYNYEKFNALMDEYAASIDVKSVDWQTVPAASFDGMLGWLEYNVKRAAGVLGCGTEERKAGEEQVLGTIAELKRQTVQMAQLKSWLEEL